MTTPGVSPRSRLSNARPLEQADPHCREVVAADDRILGVRLLAGELELGRPSIANPPDSTAPDSGSELTAPASLTPGSASSRAVN